MTFSVMTESESESESFYSVLLQTQETSAKTISGRCRRGHLEKSIHECMYVKYYYLINQKVNVIIYNIAKSM